MDKKSNDKIKHIVIINPVAGNKRNQKYLNTILKIFDNNNKKCIVFTTEYPGHATKIAKDCTSKEKCRIYSVGGDGTLSEIVNGMAFTDSELVVLPGGTGNDFSKTISDYQTLRKILISSFSNIAVPMDLIKINKRYCINVTSLGLDALVGKNVDLFRNLRFLTGKAKYNLSILYTAFTKLNFKFKFNCKDYTKKGKFTLGVIANAKYYGGGVCPTPDADPKDGLMDICIVDATNILEKVILLPKYKRGEHQDLDKCHIFRTDEIKVVSTRMFPMSIDGEVVMANRVHAKIMPKCINIVTTFKIKN